MPEFRNPLSLGDALYRAVTGKSPKSEGKTTKARAEELVKAHDGSTAKAAQAAGVSQRTVQRWLKGTQEAKNTARGQNADNLAAAQRAARITEGRKAKFSGSATRDGDSAGAGGLTLKARVIVSDDDRDRAISPGKYIPPGELDQVVELIATQGPDAAAAELNRLIAQWYVPGMRISEIEWIEYD